MDLGAVARNYRFFRERAGAAETGATIKADAYGLGAERVAPVLEREGCRTFFTAHAEGGAALRKVLSQSESRIYVYNGVLAGETPIFLEHRLRPVLNSAGQIAVWRDISAKEETPPPAALHVDTGMNRLGVSLSEAETLAGNGALEGVRLSLLMSHLACADDPAHAMNARQLAAFRKACALFPQAEARSIANSAGTLLGPDCAFDLVRPGIGLYGGAPLLENGPPLAPVATVEAPILQVRRLAAGQPVGYGAGYMAERDMLTATVALGYADGFLRAGGHGGFGVLSGMHCPIVGRVSMDLIVLDVTEAHNAARVGERVSFLGPDLDAQAAAAGTISYELLTRLGQRFERIYSEP